MGGGKPWRDQAVNVTFSAFKSAVGRLFRVASLARFQRAAITSAYSGSCKAKALPYTSSFFLPLLNAFPYQTTQDKAAVGAAEELFQVFVDGGVYYQRAERALAAVDFPGDVIEIV